MVAAFCLHLNDIPASPIEFERGSRPPLAEFIPMAKSGQKIQLSASRNIPFNKLVLSQANVRRIKAGVSIEELAEDMARRTHSKMSWGAALAMVTCS